MKAIELQDHFGIESLKLVERPKPAPGPGQILLKMRAFSLNYRDLLVVQGSYNPKLRFPATPLSDGVGEVAEVGAGVTRVKVGERVAGTFMQDWIDGDLNESRAKSALGAGGPGLLAEYVVLGEQGVVSLPEHLSDVEGATLPCAAVTAWHALVDSGHVKAGDTVLIQGTGGVSLFALQFANMHGARCFVISSSDDKLALAQKLGAAAGVNYKKTPDWEEAIRALSGAGVDHVVEVGGAGTLGKSLRAVRVGGHIALIGVLAAGAAVNPIPILMKNVRVQGIHVGNRTMFEAMNRAIAQHQMRPVVDRVFGWTDLAAALQTLASGSHFGKICLRG